ncbi:MAG TPA: GNAT family protein [Actinomycetota bacterium]|nr:GNAT family protein [Actinomycetota bacterium]
MQAADADAVAAWRYEPPYDFYDTAADPSSLMEVLDASRWGDTYFSVCSGPEAGPSELVGFLGLTPLRSGELEIGLGLRPDLTGRGLGLTFVEACLDFARSRFDSRSFVLHVATFNQRARTVYQRAGFVPQETSYRHLSGRRWEFLRMSRPA